MGRKTKEEKTDMPEQLAPKVTTKRARRKQEVLPEVKALLDQAEAIKQNAKAAQKNARIAERIFKLVDKLTGGGREAIARISYKYSVPFRFELNYDAKDAAEYAFSAGLLGDNRHERILVDQNGPVADEVAPRD